jgi:hypothetical protein
MLESKVHGADFSLYIMVGFGISNFELLGCIVAVLIIVYVIIIIIIIIIIDLWPVKSSR